VGEWPFILSIVASFFFSLILYKLFFRMLLLHMLRILSYI
jgi:hypothetical protein